MLSILTHLSKIKRETFEQNSQNVTHCMKQGLDNYGKNVNCREIILGMEKNKSLSSFCKNEIQTSVGLFKIQLSACGCSWGNLYLPSA